MPVELPPLPPDYVTTREGLHALAEHVLSPLRHRAEGRIGLQPTVGGFGPPLPDGRTVEVDADRLVDGDRSEPITTLGAAASFLDVPVGAPTDVYQPATDADPDRSLGIDPEAAAAIGRWFTFGRDVLAELAAAADPEDEPTEIQLWPEHFDLALSIGPEGARVNVGASPGDGDHDEPYLYVGPLGSAARRRVERVLGSVPRLRRPPGRGGPGGVRRRGQATGGTHRLNCP